MLVTSGGVSVGELDLVRRVEAGSAWKEVFWGVSMRPGKPVSFGVRDRTLVSDLPGNPVSALVGALLFVRRRCGRCKGRYDRGRASTWVSWPSPRGSIHVGIRSRARSPARRRRARSPPPVAGQESHMIVRASRADALVHLAPGEG